MTGDFYECPKCGWRARLSDVDIRTRCSCGRMVQLPAATAPNPRAWAVARELAAEAGLDWGLAATGRTRRCAPDFCLPDEFCGGDIGDGWLAFFDPLPAPWDADAYRADCARRGVEPGPMPSLEYGDGRTRWSVKCWNEEQLEVIVECGRARLSWWADGSTIVTSLGCMNLDDLARAVTLATAAKRAMGT